MMNRILRNEWTATVRHLLREERETRQSGFRNLGHQILRGSLVPLGLAACLLNGFGEETLKRSGNYSDLSLEELMDVSVTSVSKKEQKLFDAAAAVSVLSNDDLRRSGATSVAEALRMVPGMSVGAISSSQWAVSTRGFNSLYANKLLVLVDGRAVYNPAFSGVYWDLQQMALEDVDRIEVIRGPGATVWGANAVNGVINVVSRSAKDSQGGLIYGGGGDVHQAFGGARYGGKIGEETYYRVFGSYQLNSDYLLPNGQRALDKWQGAEGGFRLDRDFREDAHLTWQADATTCDASHRTDKKILVRVTQIVDRVEIAISDNGIGISPENLTRIFAHGFTTRKDGHGFGLHSGALAAKEMGGALTVHSDGVGRGATFNLELPLQPIKTAA